MYWKLNDGRRHFEKKQSNLAGRTKLQRAVLKQLLLELSEEKKSLSKSRTPFCAAFSCSHRVPRDVKKQSETISYHPKRARLKSQKVAAFLVKVKLWHIWRQIRRKLTIFMHVFNGGDENHGISDAQLSFREHNSKYTFENTFFRILVLGSYHIITFLFWNCTICAFEDIVR